MNPPLAFMAMVKATRPGGLRLPSIELDGTIPEIHAYVDLMTLAAIGLVTVEDDTVRMPEVFLPLLLAVLGNISEILDGWAED